MCGPLVEIRLSTTEISRVAGLAREFPEAAGDFTQRLCPAAGGVCHQRHAQALVAEILGHRDRGINTGFSRRDRHIRCIGNDDRAFHQRPTGAGVLQLRKLVQHAGHFITAFTATDIDNHVRITPFCQRLLQHGLAGAEATGHGGAAAAGQREQAI